MIICVHGAKNHSFPDFRESSLELVIALFTPHQTTPNPTKNLFARASPGTKQRDMRRKVSSTSFLLCYCSNQSPIAQTRPQSG